MPIPAEILQFAGSFAAIIVVAWLVERMGLGQAPSLRDDAEANAIADQISDGFSAIEVARDAEGRGALLRNAGGRIMLVKRHGNRFAGRTLSAGANARLWTDQGQADIQVNSGEKRFGTVFLQIENAASWVEAINRLDKSGNA